MEARDSFKSRLGFILVSAGCAIGIGNVWRFPYVTGEYGGAVFVLFYLLFLVILGIPVVTMELAVGRASRKSVKEGFMKLEPPGTWWHLHGWIALAGSFVLMIYYTTISGWMVDYFVRFLDGSFQGLSTKEVADVFGSMLANPTELLGFMGLNVLIGFAVCAGGSGLLSCSSTEGRADLAISVSSALSSASCSIGVLSSMFSFFRISFSVLIWSSSS